MSYNIAIIGAGQIGSRHLQGVALTTFPLQIQLVDPSTEALDVAKGRYEEVLPASSHTLSLHTAIEELSQQLDLVIVATGSNVRRKIVEELLDKKEVRYLVLEKVLFQQVEDYIAIYNLIEQKNVKTWVNHPRRMYPYYQQLRRELEGEQHINMHMVGNNWGLGCNGLHWLDLFIYLTNKKQLSIHTNSIDKQVQESKRVGYVEFTGTLYAHDEIGNTCTLTSLNAPFSAMHILFTTPQKRILIHEAGNGCIVSVASLQSDWKFEVVQYFDLLYQSKLSNIFLEDLLTKGICDLPDYHTSMQLHLPFIEALIQHLNTVTDKTYTSCPIT